MRATHDWSHELLERPEQLVLRRLACFTGYFTMAAAGSIAADEEITPTDVVDHVAALVTKSLVAADVGGSVAHYRLLETTRAYALEKLHEGHEFDQTALRHGTYFSEYLDGAWAEKGRLFDEGGYQTIADQLGNVRAALQWSFSESGDRLVAVRLTAGAGLYFVELGLMTEARHWTRWALDSLDEEHRNTRLEMMLQYAHAHAMVVTRGNTDESNRAVVRSIELATILKDYDLIIRVLGGYHMFLSRSGDNKAAMRVATRARDVAKQTDDPHAIAMADAMLSRSYHYGGEQEKAEASNRAVFERAPLSQRINTIRFGHDHRARALGCEASILWLVGRPVQARASIMKLLQLSDQLGDPITGVQAWYAASVIALQCGDWDWARGLIKRLGEIARTHEVAPFPIMATSLATELAYRRNVGLHETTLSDLKQSFDAVRMSHYNPAYHGIALIEALTTAGHCTEAQVLHDELVADMEKKGQLLYMPEYRRLQGDVLTKTAGSYFDQALRAYQEAIQLAQEQAALAWELRASVSLARLLRPQAPQQAETALLPVYQRYTEGFETVDLMAAKQLLDKLSSELASRH